MCEDGHARHQPAPVLHDFEPAVPVTLDPVDSVELFSLMDNVTDVFMPDQGPARAGWNGRHGEASGGADGGGLGT